jgi:SAM-dependent methyltransferase
MTTLVLGCGNKPQAGAVNHDLHKHRPDIDVAHDLNVTPWPWPDESFDLIVAAAVLEHLDIDLVASLDECWRILRPGGKAQVKVPYWRSDMAHRDPTHRWFFALGSFDQFDPDLRRGREYAFYTERHWKIVKGPKLNGAKSSIYVTMQVRK